MKARLSLSAIFLLPSLPPNLSSFILPPFLPLFSFFPSLLLTLLGDHVVFEHVEGGCLFITLPFPFLSASFSDLSFSPHFSLGSGQPIKFVQWCEKDDVKLLSDESVKGLIAAQHQEHGWCKASDEG